MTSTEKIPFGYFTDNAHKLPEDISKKGINMFLSSAIKIIDKHSLFTKLAFKVQNFVVPFLGQKRTCFKCYWANHMIGSMLLHHFLCDLYFPCSLNELSPPPPILFLSVHPLSPHFFLVCSPPPTHSPEILGEMKLSIMKQISSSQ